MSNKKCEVKDCTGNYIRTVLSYVNLKAVHTPDYEVSIEDYSKLENKKGYCAVTSNCCNVCTDDLDKRLVSFINKNF